jgi:hypothetical protein
VLSRGVLGSSPRIFRTFLQNSFLVTPFVTNRRQ